MASLRFRFAPLLAVLVFAGCGGDVPVSHVETQTRPATTTSIQIGTAVTATTSSTTIDWGGVQRWVAGVNRKQRTPVLTGPALSGPPASSSVDWDAIARCETGSNWQAHGSRYSSGLGILNQAVRENATPEIAARVLAGVASREEQIAIGERIRARFGIGAWTCGRKLAGG